MRTLDNINVGPCLFAKIRAKVKICAAIGALVFAVTGCRRAASAPPAQPSQPATADVLRQADDLYSARQDPLKVRQAIIALQQAQASEPSSYDLAWRLAKFNYYLGAHSPDDTEKERAFHDGIEAGKLAVELQPDKPDGHFWLGTNYGGNAQINTLAGLADIDDIKHEMETVLKIDERYQAGSAYMVLGQVYLEAPRLLGGDTEKAIANFEKGIRVGPDNALMRAHLAEAYVQAHRNGDARKQIDALLAMKPAPGYEPEYNEAVTQVKMLRDKIK
jgi:tetratricopeptide (TPR) repeat protein